MGGLKKTIKAYLERQKKWICLGVFFVFVILVLLVVILWPKKKEEPKEEIITKASLEKIIDISELSSFEAVHNGVAVVMNEKKQEKVDYYVSYEAKVKAGIDFDQIVIAVDNENKIINIDIPEVRITEVVVESGSMEYIFVNDKANTETVSQQAYKACLADVEKESEEAEAIKELAEQNARNVIEALVKPFVMQLDVEYTIEVR